MQKLQKVHYIIQQMYYTFQFYVFQEIFEDRIVIFNLSKVLYFKINFTTV